MSSRPVALGLPAVPVGPKGRTEAPIAGVLDFAACLAQPAPHPHSTVFPKHVDAPTPRPLDVLPAGVDFTGSPGSFVRINEDTSDNAEPPPAARHVDQALMRTAPHPLPQSEPNTSDAVAGRDVHALGDTAPSLPLPVACDMPVWPGAIAPTPLVVAVDGPLTAFAFQGEPRVVVEPPSSSAPDSSVAEAVDLFLEAGIPAGSPPALGCDVQLPAVPQFGVNWAVERPWHLAANAGLSYRAAGVPIDVVPSQVALEPTRPPAELHAPGYFVQRLGLLASTRAPPEIEMQTTADEAAVGGTTSSLTRKRSEAAPSDSTSWQSVPAWPQRLLRWTDDTEGSTAWIRDFNLPADEHGPLVTVLRGMADAQGISLRRIMLNGHVLWRSSSR